MPAPRIATRGRRALTAASTCVPAPSRGRWSWRPRGTPPSRLRAARRASSPSSSYRSSAIRSSNGRRRLRSGELQRVQQAGDLRLGLGRQVGDAPRGLGVVEAHARLGGELQRLLVAPARAVGVARSRQQRPARGDVEGQEDPQLERFPELDEAAQRARLLCQRGRCPRPPSAAPRSPRARWPAPRRSAASCRNPCNSLERRSSSSAARGVIEPARSRSTSTSRASARNRCSTDPAGSRAPRAIARARARLASAPARSAAMKRATAR